MTNTTITPKGTTHIKLNKDNEPIMFYKLSPVQFNDGTIGESLQYFNYDWNNWQGLVNTRNEVMNLIKSNDKSIIVI